MSDPPDGGLPSVGEPHDAPEPQTDSKGDADVHAFLIADVRGYTRFTQERGDEEGARLAARFAQVVRALVEEHRGRVVELRGDEALVVFGSPRSAIRGAVALQQRFVEETIADPSFPLTVGIGLDAGEAVPVEGGYRGAALNVAGRLCSLARAGEVLASREIVHLARRLDGVRFTERGQADLKGIEQPVHVVVVRSEEQDAAEAIAPFVRLTVAAPAPRRRWKVVSAAVAFAVVAALVAIPLTAGGSSEIAPNSIGVMDPESGEVTGTIGLAERPGSVAASAGAVWVTNPDVGTVTLIDANDQQLRDSIPVGEDPAGLAVGFDAVWVVESGGPSVSRVSPDTNEVVGDPIAVGNGPVAAAVGEGSVWVTNRFHGTISRIDPDRGEVIETIPVGPDPRGVAVGFGSVWVGLAGSNKIVRVDPDTSSVTPIAVGNAPGSVAVTTDAVWVVNTLDDTVTQINPDTNSVAATIPVGNGPSGIAVVQGTVWVSNEADGTLSRIEPGEPLADSIVIGSVPQGLAGVNGHLWVSVRGTATSHRGGTLRVVSLYEPSTLDPAVAYGYIEWRLLHLIGDGLVAFKSVGGTDGATLVPDLATTIPTPAEEGRRYSFDLRSEIRYSNGEVVAPADFREAIERVFRLGSDGAFLFRGLVGGDACVEAPRTCDLSEGIETDEATGTITFNLLEPDPEFLYKLTLPFAYPAPAAIPEGHRRRAGIPGTGPYRLEAPMSPEGGLALVRNPHFTHVWSPAAQPDGYVDRLEWTSGVEPQAQVDAVVAGDTDLAFDADASSEIEQTLVRFAGQVHDSQKALTYYIVLDTDAPPFDDLEVRKALNSAIDRHRIVEIFGGEATGLPTCQTLPPNFPGYEAYCPYTAEPGPDGMGSWTAPGLNLDEARGVVRRSGTIGMRVVFEYPDFWGAQGARLGDYMIELLGELGYDGRVRIVSTGEFYSRGYDFQMALDAFAADYPAASTFVTTLFGCDGTYSPSAASTGFCVQTIEAMIDRATQLQVDDPAAAGLLWAETDRAIVVQAPYVWLMNGRAVEFVSERVGNYQWSLQWGSLLNHLWVE